MNAEDDNTAAEQNEEISKTKNDQILHKNEDDNSFKLQPDSNLDAEDNQYINVNKLESQTNPQSKKSIIIDDYDEVEDINQEFKFNDLEDNRASKSDDHLTSTITELQNSNPSNIKNQTKNKEEEYEEPI